MSISTRSCAKNGLRAEHRRGCPGESSECHPAGDRRGTVVSRKIHPPRAASARARPASPEPVRSTPPHRRIETRASPTERETEMVDGGGGGVVYLLRRPHAPDAAPAYRDSALHRRGG